MIWEITAMGDKIDKQMFSTNLDSHDYMVVVGKQACIIQRSGKIPDVCTFLNECSNMEELPIIDAALGTFREIS